MRATSRLLAPLLAVALSACSGEVKPLPLGAKVTCAADADCPSGFFCSKALGGRCIEKGGADQTPPAFVGTPTVTPSTARAGTPVTVTFKVNEDLNVDPDVRFSGASEPLGLPSRSGRDYTVEFPAATAFGDGTKSIVATLVDLSGNTATNVLVGPLTLDFTPPSASSPTYSTAFARSGTTFSAGITFTEPLGGTPSLTLEGGPALTATPGPGVNGWTFSRTLTGTEPAGPADLLLDTADVAGNPLQLRYTDAVTLDFTAPTVAQSTVGTPSVRAGDSVVASLQFSEPLGTPPVATLAPSGGGTALPVTVSALDAANYALSYDVPLGAANGTFTLTLVSAADRAGNPAAGQALGTVTFDSTAPSVTNLTPDHANRLYRAGQPVQVTFRLSEPPAATPDVRLEILPLPLPLPCTLAGGVYTCTSTALAGTELPQNVVNVSVTVADLAGNVATAGTSVILDFTAPTVLSAAPGRAAFPAGGTIAYTVSVSEPLTAPPTLAVSRGGTAVPGFFGAPSSASATTFAWSRAVPTGADGAYTVSVAVTDEAGNVAAPVAGTGFGVDTAFPSVVGNIAVSPAKPAFRATDRPAATFTVSESILAPTARLNTATPIDAPCTPAGPATTFTCTLARALLSTDTPEGAAAFLITLSDAAGNVGYGSTALTLDYTPATLASAPATRYLGSAATRGIDVRAVGTNSSWEIAILTAEPLSAAPAVTAVQPVGGTTRTLTLQSSNAPVNTSFVYTLPSSATAYPAATWSVRWNPTDLAGNTYASPQQIATVDVDGVAPAAPAPGAAASPQVVWTRTPWGTDLSTTPVFQLTATPTAVGTDADVMIAWDGSAAGAREVGRDTVDVTGFTVPLGSDPEDLWVSTLDRAGNESPRTRAVDVVWTAGLAGKVPGSTFENPHRLETRTRTLGALAQIDGVQASGSALGVAGDAKLVTTTASALWRPTAGLVDPGARVFYSLGADPGRGVVVLQNGSLLGGNQPGDTWEWNGSVWRQVFPTDPEGDGNPPKGFLPPMVFDPIRGGLLAYSSDGLWLFNGTSWRNLGPVPVPSGGIAWDAKRSVLVLLATNGATYQWNGSAWSNVTPGASPSQRGFAAVYYDNQLERTCVYGGRAIPSNTYLDDVWCFDGAAWAQQTIAGTPPFARTDFAYAWDAGRKELFVHSGIPQSSATADGRTWILRRVSGTLTWFDATLAVLAEQKHAATYDPTAKRVVLGGGLSLGSALRAWDGAAYVPLAPGDPEGDGNPSFLFRTSNPVYVPGRNRVVFAQAGTALETWEWDRASWSHRATGGGSAANASLSSGWWVNGSAQPLLVTFGGAINNTALGDTWGWNGSSWQLLNAGPGAHPAAFDLRYRTDSGLVTDPATNKLYRVGGYDSYFDTSAHQLCQLDVLEWNGTAWVASTGGGPAWNDPEGDGTPSTFLNLVVPPCKCRDRVVWSPTLGTILLLDDTGIFSTGPFVVWEWRRATTSWAKHVLAGKNAASIQGFVWDTTLAVPVIYDFSGGLAVDLTGNRLVPLVSANPLGTAPPTQGAFAFDSGAGVAVALEAGPWTWESPAKGSPAQLFTADYSRAGGPDPAVCVAGAACPIQRIDVAWSAGATSPSGGNGVLLQAWMGGWVDVATNGATAAAPSLMTYTRTPASTTPAALLFHGAARELTFALAPNGGSAGVVPVQLATDAVAVTIRYRRP